MVSTTVFSKRDISNSKNSMINERESYMHALGIFNSLRTKTFSKLTQFFISIFNGF